MSGVGFSGRFLCAAGKPGVAPAGDSLSFASPKESKQRKGDPQPGSPSGQPAVLEASGVWLNSAVASDNASPDPLPSALLGPARTGWGPSPDIQYQYRDQTENLKPQKINSYKYAPRRVLVELGDSDIELDVWVLGCPDFRTPRRNEEASSASADGSGLALSERSEFSQTPAALSNAAYRRSRATNPARLFFAYFLLAKQKKVSRPPGRVPACQPNKKAKNKSSAACARQPAPHRPGEQK
jgi:hypothetical protein